MDYQLQDWVALVNAASRGLGRAIAEAPAAEGTRPRPPDRGRRPACCDAHEQLRLGELLRL
jgi:NAD(P)-dependent dehydrogenase (short-subunit alcohol dehydrogenase family)